MNILPRVIQPLFVDRHVSYILHGDVEERLKWVTGIGCQDREGCENRQRVKKKKSSPYFIQVWSEKSVAGFTRQRIFLSEYKLKLKRYRELSNPLDPFRGEYSNQSTTFTYDYIRFQSTYKFILRQENKVIHKNRGSIYSLRGYRPPLFQASASIRGHWRHKTVASSDSAERDRSEWCCKLAVGDVTDSFTARRYVGTYYSVTSAFFFCFVFDILHFRIYNATIR